MEYYVVGGGLSLVGFDFERLRGRRVVGVNAAYTDVPFAEFNVFSDGRFHEWNYRKPEWRSFQGVHATTWQRAPADIMRFEGAPRDCVLSTRSRMLAGTNSGEKAVNLAWLLGARTIYLLGFDMKPNGNYHDRHQLTNRQGHYESKFVPSMTAMGHELLRTGCRVLNACPDSGLTVFPRISLDDIPG